MIEAVTQSYCRNTAAEIRSLRFQRGELKHSAVELQKRIDEINQKIEELSASLDQHALDRIDTMTVDQAEVILAAVPTDAEIAEWDRRNTCDRFE